MKTPEQIKAGLRYCTTNDFCNGCPIEKICNADVMKDALALIEQLEEQIMCMKIQMHGDCGVCKRRHHAQVRQDGPHFEGPCRPCIQKETRPNWEYEGVPELPKKGESA